VQRHIAFFLEVISMIPYTTTLTDGGITLRSLQLDDLTVLLEAVRESVSDIMPWMGWCRPDYDEDVARPWLAALPEAWEEGTQFALAITDAQSGEFLGGTGLNHVNYQYRLANLGYWVRSSATGRGIATRAARLVGEFAVKQVGLLRAEIVVAVGNKPSLRVAEKCGCKPEGVLRNRLIVREKVFDAVMHALTPQDYGITLEPSL
jgi:RimJ/RimL family protein N-acetyltransferase